MKRTMAALAAGVGMLALAGTANAVTVSSNPTCTNGNNTMVGREYTITVGSAGGSCLIKGAGNLEGNGSDEVNLLGYLTLDKTDDNVTGSAQGALTTSPLNSGLSGTFTIDASKVAGFTDLIIAFKTGTGQLDPDWAAFILPAGVLTGSWTISGQQELSHANLYGKVIPIPPAALLFGTALAGVGFMSRRKKAANAA